MEVSDNSRAASTDFSIERILSEEPREPRLRQDGREPAGWLCCTRYRPPKLPRSNNSSGGGGGAGRRAGRHARVPFTAEQAAALEAAYARAPYLAPPALRALAAALGLRDDRIKIWFQNRRARERREKTSTITPPGAVALPATTPARLEWRARDAGGALHRISPPDSHLVLYNAVTAGCTGVTGASGALSSYEESLTPAPDDETGYIGVSATRPQSPILDVETVADDFDET